MFFLRFFSLLSLLFALKAVVCGGVVVVYTNISRRSFTNTSQKYTYAVCILCTVYRLLYTKLMSKSYIQSFFSHCLQLFLLVCGCCFFSNKLIFLFLAGVQNARLLTTNDRKYFEFSGIGVDRFFSSVWFVYLFQSVFELFHVQVLLFRCIVWKLRIRKTTTASAWKSSAGDIKCLNSVCFALNVFSRSQQVKVKISIIDEK